MKKILLLAFTFVPTLLSAQSNPFNLNAKIGNENAPAMAYLNYRQDGKSITDSSMLSNGSFSFKGLLSGPVRAQLILDHAGEGMKKLGRTADVLSIYLESGAITVISKDSVKNAVISGSKINTENIAYKKFLSAPDQKIAAINTEYMAASADKKKDKDFTNSLQEKYNQASEERKELQYQYIKQNPDAYLSLVALSEVAGASIDVNKIEPIYKSLSISLRKSASGLEFAKTIELARATSVGAVAPVFTQNDINDKPVKLSDFRGKYVLVDFWASWCGPCRAENPNVVKAYTQYKDKNFTVLGVSLDRPGKKEAWLAAIKADGLEWTQVSDLKFWDNEVAKQYGIRSIPQNFLIDPTGKIVGKNLRGEELDKKLKEIFGS